MERTVERNSTLDPKGLKLESYMWCYVAARLGYTILRAGNKIECVSKQDAEEDVWSLGRGNNFGIE